MIKSTRIRTGKGLDLVDDFARAFPALVQEATADAANAVEPFALDELRTYPGPAKHPFQWSDDPAANERGRRGYFARYPNGRPRTGEYGRKWFMVVNLRSNGGSVSLGNSHPEAARIGGPLNPTRTRKRQVPGHRRTGWPLVKPTVDFWLAAVQEETRERLFKLMSGR